MVWGDSGSLGREGKRSDDRPWNIDSYIVHTDQAQKINTRGI